MVASAKPSSAGNSAALVRCMIETRALWSARHIGQMASARDSVLTKSAATKLTRETAIR